MTIKEIHSRAGSMWSYVNYIYLVFCWYFLDNWFNSLQADSSQSSMLTLTDWGLRLFIVPLLLASVYGGIYRQQHSQGEWGIEDVLRGFKANAWRFVTANFLSIFVFAIVSVAVLMIRGITAAEINQHKLLAASLSIPYSMINLFWFAAITVEHEIFRGLFQALRTLLLNPFALLIAFSWAVISFADATGIEFPKGQFFLAIDAARAAVLAAARIGAILYTFAIYSKGRGDIPEAADEVSLAESQSFEDKLANASFGFTFVSFLPVLHLVALILGIVALKRKQQFVMKAAIACCTGGFFTLFYAFMVVGLLLNKSIPSANPGYGFLSDASAALKPQVTLLEQGSFKEVQTQLEQNITPESQRPWAFDTALALAKLKSVDLKGSLEDFQFAAEKNPERGEFYYYYGIALLKNNEPQRAAEQFQNALSHQPKLDRARQYLTLIQNEYKPSQVLSAFFFMIILLMLFTLHEFGHAYAATKLGDDTAKNLGRLTLNPIAHLEPFGSIILPAILVFQGSEFVFGWAKPVPVNTANFKNPQKDHMVVSFAGPAMNLLISMVTLIVLGIILLFVRVLWPGTLSLHLASPFSSVSFAGPPFARSLIIVVIFLKQLFYTSLILGCFNLLPIPPLDGSWIFSGMLPQRLRNLFEKTRQFGFLIFLLLVVTSVLDYILIIPVTAAWAALQLLASAMGFG